LVRRPKIVLADEPTAALDKQSGRDVVELLRQLARQEGCAVLLVTHDNRILDIADRLMLLEDGRLSSFAAVTSPHAGHLLTALAQIPGRQHLELLVGRLTEPEFLDLLKTMSAELEQFLNVLDLGGGEAAAPLFDNLLETVLLKIAGVVGAQASALYFVDQGRLSQAIAAGQGAVADEAAAASAAATESIVNVSGRILCIPIRNRHDELSGVAQFIGKEDAGFTAAHERALRDYARALGIMLESCRRSARSHLHSPAAAAS
jgi:putative ABC transport system ATP-binding protein